MCGDIRDHKWPPYEGVHTKINIKDAYAAGYHIGQNWYVDDYVLDAINRHPSLEVARAFHEGCMDGEDLRFVGYPAWIFHD